MQALAALVLIATPNIVETAPGALDMLRSKYHPLRLGLCFFSLAVVGLAVMLDDLTGGFARWRPRAVGVGGAGGEEASRPRLAAAFVALAASPPLGYRRSATIVVLVGLSLAATWGCQALGQRWHRDYVAHYDGFFRTGVYGQAAALDPDRVRIAVCDYLDDQRVTIVVARPRDPRAKRWYARFHGWISDHPDLFETIHEDAEYILVRSLNQPRPNLPHFPANSCQPGDKQ